ncbi:hypothetical protein HJC23_006346 [Cyclotella cryptica]|uniref:Uncharacterized protein n=1 Tax=Cyclotella cryptica TaxID=29204 RepID=A0ABD3Q4C5_9STRA|eukprot:CCRYP_008741-RA/>CCRYP_008741-RA protein AED:0.00 eAED:0.00 QI:128/-1/1/1/-1/1/1/338/820
MAPPLTSNDGDSSALSSIYKFPAPSTNPQAPATPKRGGETKSAMSTKTTTMPPPTLPPTTPHYVCSPITADAARYFLLRRLLLPTLAVPVLMLVIPPVIMSFVASLAYVATHSSGEPLRLSGILVVSALIVALTYCLVHMGTSAIRRHAPSEKQRKEALEKSRYALPFWSLIVSLMVVRSFHAFFGLVLHSLMGSSESETSMTGTQGWIGWTLGLFATSWFWSMSAMKAFLRPVLGWAMLSITIACRYIGPFSPFMRCSCIPLRINPFDATISRIGRNFTSKERFLDFIANGLEKLASPSSDTVSNNNSKIGTSDRVVSQTKPSSQNVSPFVLQPKRHSVCALGFSTKARYSRPSLLSIVVQAAVHSFVGYFVGHTIIVAFLEDVGMIDNTDDATATIIILFSCLLGSVYELVSAVNEAELQFTRYSTFRNPNFNNVFGKIKRLVAIMVVSPFISALLSPIWSRIGHAFIHGHDVAILFPSVSTSIYSIVLSIVSTGALVGIMVIQDECTRWAICAPDINPDLLLDKSMNHGRAKNRFLAEDLYVQSILMGDGATVEKVISPDVARSKTLQEDEMLRNEEACASFASWVMDVSTLHPGKVCDDILRMCLLYSLGGESSTQRKSILKRLHLSAATSAPRSQPIVVPLARSLLAFAGGLGESMVESFRQEQNDAEIITRSKSAESWVLPSGSLTAGQYSISGAARVLATNHSASEKYKTNHLSLLMPCVLQSAFKLRCGIFEYALFQANQIGANLSTPDRSGLFEFISSKCPELLPVIFACDDSAKTVIKCLRETGDESVLLRFKGEMKIWIVDLNCEIAGA